MKNRIKALILCFVCIFSGTMMITGCSPKPPKGSQVVIVDKEFTGTGFLISRDGLFVTCYHVIEGAKSIYINGLNSNLHLGYAAEVELVDPQNDLAILRIKDPGYWPYNEPESPYWIANAASPFKTTFGAIPYAINASLAAEGEECFTIGFPKVYYQGEDPKLTSGVISSRTGFGRIATVYQISTPIQGGNSGGPLFDKFGNVIGIVNAQWNPKLMVDDYDRVVIDNFQNVNYAVKSSILMSLIESLPKKLALPQVKTASAKEMPQFFTQYRDFIGLVHVQKKGVKRVK
ncbi:MAG: serine protease [Bacteroidetes bacterium]|nr:serine protease [Bacteroidota bacterium]